MKRTFLILSLPRCRTAWLSHFLTCGPIYCHHDLSGDLASVETMAGRIIDTDASFVGSADSGNVLLFDELYRLLDSASCSTPKLVIVWRAVEQVTAALEKVAKIPLEQSTPAICEMHDRLEKIAADHPDALQVGFDSLDEKGTLFDIWKHVAPRVPFYQRHAEKLLRHHIEVDPLLMVQAALTGQPESVLSR